MYAVEFYLTDAGKVIQNLLLLVFELLFIWETLPLATAANSEMRAERYGPKWRGLVELYGCRFAIMMFFLLDFQVDHISGNDKGNENYHVVHTGQSFALGCHIRNCNIL